MGVRKRDNSTAPTGTKEEAQDIIDGKCRLLARRRTGKPKNETSLAGRKTAADGRFPGRREKKRDPWWFGTAKRGKERARSSTKCEFRAPKNHFKIGDTAIGYWRKRNSQNGFKRIIARDGGAWRKKKKENFLVKTGMTAIPIYPRHQGLEKRKDYHSSRNRSDDATRY